MARFLRDDKLLPEPILTKCFHAIWHRKASMINSSPPSVAYMPQWIKLSIGSDNGMLPILHQAIVWNNAGLLSIGPLGTRFSEILIKIQNFSFTQMHL